MPRPGPRPYECVRRAWHSERHQPMRGSLIKEIFRIANEIHSPTTKKNKEWQEKLPIVVLKAEEIMYSKANSEAEYMDPKTHWERVNDAIDTIIRRDDSAETGELLQPCIEAALNLGCIPRRASRSQRKSDPRFYLGAYSLDRGDGIHNPTSALGSQYPSFLNLTALSSKVPGKDPHNCGLPMFNGNININSYSAYPLYHGTYPTPEPQPSFLALPANAPKLSIPNASPCDKESSTTITEEDRPEELVCDLSLRLAPLSVSAPCTNISSKDTKLTMDKPKFKLCTWASADPALGLSSGMMESQGGNPSPYLRMIKRRAVEVEDNQQFSRQPKLLCAYSAGPARVAGL